MRKRAAVGCACAFVCGALQPCLLAKYLQGVIWALETVFASCFSRRTYCLTKCWNTEESAGCSQWPQVKNCSEICSPKNKNHDGVELCSRKWEAVQYLTPRGTVIIKFSLYQEHYSCSLWLWVIVHKSASVNAWDKSAGACWAHCRPLDFMEDWLFFTV